MIRRRTGKFPRPFIVLSLTLFGGGILAPRFLALQQAGDDPSRIVFYFDDGPHISETWARDGTVYFPVLALARRMSLPYTDASAAGTLTIRGPGGTLEAAIADPVIRVGAREIRMNFPILREDGRWWAPREFFTDGLAEVAGVPFRFQTERPRVFVLSTAPAVLDLGAEQSPDGTRLTLRTGTSVNVRVQREESRNEVVLSIDRSPLNPTREELDYRDGTVRSVRYDDSDGNSRVVVETTGQVANVRLVPSDENRTFFVDFIREETPPAVEIPAAVPPVDVRASAGRLRVIVIDPGHGGLDSGVSAHGTLEKDLTLAIARRLRSALEARLEATVILTRDGDREMSHQQRAAIANNTRANLLISLHVGYSFDPSESVSSLFVMSPLSGDEAPRPAAGALFRPWYEAYRTHAAESLRFAEILRRNMDTAVPRWEFLIRRAPVALLASVAMPSLVIELGNANNDDDLEALGDLNVENLFIEATIDAIETFGGT